MMLPAILWLISALVHFVPYVDGTSVTRADVEAAQKAWGDALVSVSRTYDDQGLAAAKTLAQQVIDVAYGYQYGPVLFKPTLTSGNQTFRTTREGALAYFVGNDPNFPADSGFALNHWRNVEIQNAAIFTDGNTGSSTGNVIITDRDGKATVVDKTWTFFKAPDGKLRIVAHHSSLPYRPRGGSFSRAEVEAAQQAWGDALVSVSRAYDEKGFEAAKALAERLIDELYGYQMGPVLFKPTLAYGSTAFRTTREAALSYFVGHDVKYPTDRGFALKHWRRVDAQNAAIFVGSDSGTSVGNVFFTDADGEVTVVDKTWTFVKDSKGKVRIMVHHSSLPYLPSSPSKAVPPVEVHSDDYEVSRATLVIVAVILGVLTFAGIGAGVMGCSYSRQVCRQRDIAQREQKQADGGPATRPQLPLQALQQVVCHDGLQEQQGISPASVATASPLAASPVAAAASPRT